MVDRGKLRGFLFLGEAGFAFGFADEAHCSVERAVVAEGGIADHAVDDEHRLFIELRLQIGDLVTLCIDLSEQIGK